MFNISPKRNAHERERNREKNSITNTRNIALGEAGHVHVVSLLLYGRRLWYNFNQIIFWIFIYWNCVTVRVSVRAKHWYTDKWCADSRYGPPHTHSIFRPHIHAMMKIITIYCYQLIRCIPRICREMCSNLFYALLCSDKKRMCGRRRINYICVIWRCW